MKNITLKDVLKYLGLSIIFSIIFSACGPAQQDNQTTPVAATQSQTSDANFNEDGTVKEKPASFDVSTLDGAWAFDDGNLRFEATAGQAEILISMTVGDSTALYWAGTFEEFVQYEDKVDVVSQANEKALKRSLFGSKDSTKTFTYEDGKLSFKFTAMGVTKTVSLEKK